MEGTLEPTQEQLLIAMIEAERAEPSSSPFTRLSAEGGYDLRHLGFPGGRYLATRGDVYALEAERLIETRPQGNAYYLTPRARTAYNRIQSARGLPERRVSYDIHAGIASLAFEQRFPQATGKWRRSEGVLREENAEYGQIGILCRESLQLFVTELAQVTGTSLVDEQTSRTKIRMTEILDRAPAGGDSEEKTRAVLKALWDTVADAVQPVVHATEKRGTPISREEARRIVFLSGLVMFEIDRALLSRIQPG